MGSTVGAVLTCGRRGIPGSSSPPREALIHPRNMISSARCSANISFIQVGFGKLSVWHRIDDGGKPAVGRTMRIEVVLAGSIQPRCLR